MVKLPKKSRMKFDWKFDWNCQLKLLLKMVRKLLKLIPSIKMTKRQWGRHWKLLGAQKVENMTSLGPKLDKESENSGRKCKKREHFFTQKGPKWPKNDSTDHFWMPGGPIDPFWMLWKLKKVKIWPLWVQNLTKKVKILDENAKNESISSLKMVQNDLKFVKSALETVEISSRVPNTAIELQFDSPSRHRFTFLSLLIAF